MSDLLVDLDDLAFFARTWPHARIRAVPYTDLDWHQCPGQDCDWRPSSVVVSYIRWAHMHSYTGCQFCLEILLTELHYGHPLPASLVIDALREPVIEQEGKTAA